MFVSYWFLVQPNGVAAQKTADAKQPENGSETHLRASTRTEGDTIVLTIEWHVDVPEVLLIVALFTDLDPSLPSALHPADRDCPNPWQLSAHPVAGNVGKEGKIEIPLSRNVLREARTGHDIRAVVALSDEAQCHLFNDSSKKDGGGGRDLLLTTANAPDGLWLLGRGGEVFTSLKPWGQMPPKGYTKIGPTPCSTHAQVVCRIMAGE